VSRSLNKAIIIGNLGSDPEIRSIGSGTRVAKFSVATSRSWTGRDGTQQEKTEWHRIVVWESDKQAGGGLFGVVERYVKKGDRVYVEGEIEYSQYEDKDGITKYSTEIRARDLMMLGGKEGSGGGGGIDSGEAPRRERAPAPTGGGRPAPSGGGKPAKGGDYDDFPTLDEDDDLPF
jgi:single-strand DNA-binding protein